MSNNTLIGALRAEATLESGKFVDGAKKIRNEAKKTEVQLKQSFGTMGSAVKGFGTALTAGLSIGLLSATIKKSLDYASSLKTISQQAGVTTRDLQTLRFAATQNGLTVAQFDDGLTKLKETLGKVAAGSAAPTKALNALGISAKEISGVDTATAFKMISDKLAAIPDPAKRAAFELALFGEAGSKLDPLLSKGSGAMNELAQAAKDLGIVLSDRQIQSADETAAKLDQVKMVLAAQISGVVADNASSIATLAGALGQLTGAIVNFLGSNPMAAVGILGALAGGRIGGLPGAALGGFAGLVAGAGYSAEHQYQSVRGQGGALLRHNFIQSVDRARNLRKSGDTAGANAEYARAKRIREKYLASGGTIPGYNPNAIPNVPIPQFMAPKPRGGGHPRTRRGPRDRSEDATFQVEQEIRRADMDILRARQSLAHGSAAQTDLAVQMLDLEKQMFEAEQDHKVAKAQQDFAEGKITKVALDEVVASTAILKAKYDEKDALERQALIEDQQRELDEAAFRLANEKRQLSLDDLQAAAQLAETASERREIGLQILDAQLEQKRLELEHEKQLAIRNGATADEIAAIQARIDHLPTERAQGEASVRQGTRGPWEDYLASLPSTAAKADEALQRLEVDGMQGLTDAAMALADGLDSAKDALLQTLKDFFLGLARLELQKGLASILGNGPSPLSGIFGGIQGAFGSGSTGSGAMSAIDFATPGMGSLSSLPQMAGGGSFRIGGIPGIDKNLLQMNGVPMGWVSLGERIDVSNDNGQRGPGGRPLVQNFNFPNSDFNSFKRSESQAARQARRMLDRA